MGAERLGADVAAVGTARVQVRGALIGADEQDPAVPGPDRREGGGLAANVAHHARARRSVPVAQQIRPGAPVSGEAPDAGVPGPGADGVGRAEAGDPGTVRRPRRVPVLPLLGRHARGRAARERDGPDVADRVAVAIGAAVRGERHDLSVGRHRRLRVVPIAVGELARTGARRIDRHDPEVLAAHVEEATLV